MTPKPSLFPGRFQPFHAGHLDALKQILRREKSVIIMIGSAENSRTKRNPFTAGERYQMIEETLRKNFPAKIRRQIAIIPVRDINNPAKWVRHVESLLPPFGNVYTGSAVVARLFKKNGGHEVRTIKKRVKISGTEVRKRMK